MSLKEWKETLRSCTVRAGEACRSSSTPLRRDGMKPPKRSLRDQMTCLEPKSDPGPCSSEEGGTEVVGIEQVVEESSEAALVAVSDPAEPLVLWKEEGFEGRVVQVPASINSRLLEHQREGVKFLYRLYRENRGGILGDDMGLGKTIQTIAFLAAVLEKGEGFERWKGDSGKAVLILCPTSVLENWEKEFEAWGAFHVGIYHGQHRDSILAKVEGRSLEILLTSHDTFRLHGADLGEVEWECVIVDEAHCLKNEKSKLYEACAKIRTKRRYGLTGTIMQNKFLEMFNVFDWAAPGCLGARDHFRDYYDKPLKEGQRISAPDTFVRIAHERKQQLVKVLDKVLLRRSKEETIGHLMMGKEDNVVFCAMSPVQKRVYQRILRSPDFLCLLSKDLPCTCGSPLTRAQCCHRTVLDGPIWTFLHRETMQECEKCPYCLVLPCLTKLQQASNHLELIKPNPRDDREKQKKDEDFAALALGDDATLVGGVLQEESFLGLSDTQHCGKMRALEKLLASWIMAGDKVLLFSYSVRMLDILEKFVIRKGYCFSRLDGSSPMSTRQSMVDDFNSSCSKQVFLISTRAGGLGLNLVSANRVVIFDPNWNPAIDLQAQDRSFRYGQTRHVTVFRLLAAGSLEELVYSRQIYKQQLFNIGVTGVNEKRYFEGVQDTRNTGELFGIGNLLKDLSDEVFTSNIIESQDSKLLTIKPDVAAKELAGDKHHLIGLKKQLHQAEDGDQDEHGLGVLARLIQADGKAAEQQLSKRGASNDSKAPVTEDKTSNSSNDELIHASEQLVSHREPKRRKIQCLPRALHDAGVVYTHRNEEVVNFGSRHRLSTNAGITKGSAITSQVDAPVANLPPNPISHGNKENKDEFNPPKAAAGARAKCIQGAAKTSSVVVPSQDKRQSFSQLAQFKGLSEGEFSKWLICSCEKERENLILDFRSSLIRSVD